MSDMPTYQIGQIAEQAACTYLSSIGHVIIKRNWRTRWCEIDIVTRLHNTLCFVEVKYRRTSSFGAGIDYITQKKLAQMARSADTYVTIHKWAGSYRLLAVEVGGNNYQVLQVIEID